MKFSQRVGGQVGLDGKQQEPYQQADRDKRVHVSRKRQTAHQRQSAKAVDDVIHIESVARALLLAHPGQRAVEAVSKPIKRKEENAGQEPVMVPGGQGVTDPGHHLGQKTQ